MSLHRRMLSLSINPLTSYVGHFVSVFAVATSCMVSSWIVIVSVQIVNAGETLTLDLSPEMETSVSRNAVFSGS